MHYVVQSCADCSIRDKIVIKIYISRIKFVLDVKDTAKLSTRYLGGVQGTLYLNYSWTYRTEVTRPTDPLMFATNKRFSAIHDPC